MIVADSSFLVQGLLIDRRLFQRDKILTLDLATYEVANAIWAHQERLKDIRDGLPFLKTFYDLMKSSMVTALSPSFELMQRAYDLSVAHGVSVYDAVFIVLALRTGLELGSFDRQQLDLMERVSNAHHRKGDERQ
ncbi:MAG: type II toxin-antitoxin system VapC family toxin [Thaumarchaeota archaeon]|nr:type II toxin-antitoxin system VapC family toxin [Nitrososphaerota archaeon]